MPPRQRARRAWGGVTKRKLCARDVDEKFGILPCTLFSSLSANPRRYVANVEVPLRRKGLSTMLFTLALHVCRLTLKHERSYCIYPTPRSCYRMVCCWPLPPSS